MKIMLVVARLNVGGVALNVIQMAEALQALPDCDVLLVNGQIGEQEGDMQYLADAAGIPQVVVPSLGRELSPWRDVRTLWTLWRLMRRYQPDVVHTHTAKAGFVGRVAAWLARVPVRVHTFHGHVFSGYFSPRKTQFFLWLERLSATISTRILTLSDALKTELSQTYRVAPPNKLVVIPLGLQLHNSSTPLTDFRQQWQLPSDAPMIAVVGRLVPIKNHDLFLRAAQMVHQQRPDVHFVIVGDGEMRPHIERQIAALQLADVVTITGWVSEISAVYQMVDVVTITSDNEGTPVSLIEAIAQQVPVVSTDVGGVRDLFAPDLFGQLVPPQDAQALADQWLATLDSPPDMSAAQQRILATYDIQPVAQQHLRLYRQLASGKR